MLPQINFNENQNYKSYILSIHEFSKDLDEVLVASESESECLTHLELVFDRLNDYGLSVKPNKCIFGGTYLDFLGTQDFKKGGIIELDVTGFIEFSEVVVIVICLKSLWSFASGAYDADAPLSIRYLRGRQNGEEILMNGIVLPCLLSSKYNVGLAN
uniref:Reverse transcriptase domain-containing protein n=1 Tax=Glossina austeni TaxID=7395 RepID=A0A1A9VGY0_GLOAU